MNRLPLLALTTIAAAFAVPAAASAATLEFTAGAGPSAEEFIVYTAGKKEKNRLTVIEGKKTLTFKDPGIKIKKKKGSFSGCTFKVGRATCKAAPFTDLVIYLGDGNDKLTFKGKNNKTSYGSAARDSINAPAQLQPVYEDTEGANTEHVYAEGGPGNDQLFGTKYHDVLVPGIGKDIVDGGKGDDTIRAGVDTDKDMFFGGGGVDTVDGTGSSALTINLGTGLFSGGADSDTVDSFEVAHGSEGDDTIIGGPGTDGLFGDEGGDELDGQGGGDYVNGDFGENYIVDEPGGDTLTGGAGDDILDGRDNDKRYVGDDLACGDGNDLTIGRVDDRVDPTCEKSASGVFSGDVFFGGQYVDVETTVPIAPVSKGADGAPTYAISCVGGTGTTPCTGRIDLQAPPANVENTNPTILGTAAFTIPRGTTQNVTVTLSAAGKTAATTPGSRVGVHVLAGESANPTPQGQGQGQGQGNDKGPDLDFGWQVPFGPAS